MPGERTMNKQMEQNPRFGFRVRVEGNLLDINLRISGKWALVVFAASLAFLIPGAKELLHTLLTFIQ